MSRLRKVRGLFSLILVTLGLLMLTVSSAAQTTGKAAVLDVKGAITPALLTYLDRGLAQAQRSDASVVIIQLDTPGGSVEIMKQLTDQIVRSEVPVIVWVGPAGARAASAGTFVVLSAHVAAMAPGTTIGAASVVDMQGQEIDETSKAKITNDLTARIRNYTLRRGDQVVTWAQSTVTDAIAATAEEVYQIGAIDLIAPDIPTLLQEIDGMKVVVAGEERTLQTANLPVQPVSMTLPEQLLHVITDPNIAFILLTLGLNGILFELASPGGYVVGVIGGVCLVLALYALGVLSVNWTGLFFIVLAFILFIVDIKATTHGVLTAAGIASFVFGALMLFNSPAYSISTALVVSVGVGTGGFFAFAVGKALAARRKPATTGREALAGKTATVRSILQPEGMVYLHGELWKARSEDAGVIQEGETVVVVRKEGFTLVVRRK